MSQPTLPKYDLHLPGNVARPSPCYGGGAVSAGRADGLFGHLTPPAPASSSLACSVHIITLLLGILNFLGYIFLISGLIRFFCPICS